jgi:hypothetical protein
MVSKKSISTNKYLLAVIVFLVLTIILILIATGIIINPLGTFRTMIRKKTYSVNVDAMKSYSEMEPPVNFDWKVKYPNKNIYILCYGGLGNTILAISLALDACIKHGIKQPVLLYENGADFDFHKIDNPKYEFEDHPTTLQEIFPWINSVITRSVLNGWISISGVKTWKGKRDTEFPLDAVNVILLPTYSNLAPISDEAFIMTKKLFSKSIFNYIHRNYNMEKAMAIHLRLGQPTDEFVPASPSIEDIHEHYDNYKPENVYLFTDNIEKASEVMKNAKFSYKLVRDINYVDLLLISLCDSAVISESTFSISACRLGNMKQVSIAMNDKDKVKIPTLTSSLPNEWKVIIKSL